MINTDSELAPAQLTLRLDIFEGPLDVLLHLIREKNLDIFDIPIQQIALEFQDFVEVAINLDLDRAGDYLSMAAELALIKSRLLLPITKEEEDPRKELVDRLIEHQQMKDISFFLNQQHLLGRDVFTRGSDPSEGIPTPPPARAEIDTNELQKVFNFLLRRAPRPMPHNSHQVRRDTMSVRQRIVWICQRLREQAAVRLTDLLGEFWEKHILIVTFLALLELSRLGKIRLSQIEDSDLFLEAIDSLDEIPLDEVETFSNIDFVQEQLDAHKEKNDKKKRKRKPKSEMTATVTPILTPQRD